MKKERKKAPRIFLKKCILYLFKRLVHYIFPSYYVYTMHKCNNPLIISETWCDFVRVVCSIVAIFISLMQ